MTRWLRVVAEEDEGEYDGGDYAQKSGERGKELCKRDGLLGNEVLPKEHRKNVGWLREERGVDWVIKCWKFLALK